MNENIYNIFSKTRKRRWGASFWRKLSSSKPLSIARFKELIHCLEKTERSDDNGIPIFFSHFVIKPIDVYWQAS